MLVTETRNSAYKALSFSVFFISFLLFSSYCLASSESVSIQLKWQHGFQFAGYYAAIEKGFYKDEGLTVSLKEIDFKKDFVQQVLDGESQYGVSDSTLLIYHLQGKPVILVNQFFQHSPLVFLSHRNSGIISPFEMVGKKVAFNSNNQGDAPLNTMLIDALGDLSKIKHVPFGTPYYQNFIDGKTDVVSAYSTSQPYLLKQQGIDVNIINPQSYGIDYYGDNLFTSASEFNKFPDRVTKISRATVKGWQYALQNPEEIIALIKQKYAPKLSLGYLQFEARKTAQMIAPDLFDIGSFDPERFQNTAEIYQRLGYVNSREINTDFFYHKGLQSIRSDFLTPEEISWIKQQNTLTYGAEIDWAPYDFVNDKGQHDGFSKDFLDEISRLTGLKFNPVVDKWNQLLKKAQQGELDLLPAVYYSEERTKFLLYSQPYQSLLGYFYVRDDIKITDLNGLSGKTIAIPKGYVDIQLIEQQFPQTKILQVDTLIDAIKSVLEHRAEILLDSQAVISYHLKNKNISNIRPFKSRPGDVNNLMMGITNNNSPLLKIINKAISKISNTKKRQLYNKWLGNTVQTEQQNLVLTDEQKSWLKQHKKIRFSGDPNWLPYEAFDQTGNYHGIVAEFLKLIEQKLSIEIERVPSKSWAESLDMMKHNEIDILSETVDSSLKSELIFTQSYIKSPVVIVMKNDQNYVENLNQIKDRKIAIIKDYGYVDTILKKYNQISFSRVSTIQEGLTAVSIGKVDALVATLAQASYHLSALGINNVRIVGKTEFNTQLAFGMKKEFAPLVEMFNQALNSISQTEKQTIFNTWGKQKFVTKFDYDLLIQITGLFLLIFAIIIYWNRRLATEVKLRKAAENQTQALIDNIPLHIFVTSLKGNVLSANPKALNDYKIAQNELNQFNILDFYYDKNERTEIIKEIENSGKIEKKIIKVKGLAGNHRQMMISIMPIKYQNQQSLLTLAIDMTERIEMEQEITHINYYSDIALELTQSGYWHVDFSSPDYYYQSERSAKLLGEKINSSGRYHFKNEWFSRLLAANPDIANQTDVLYQGAIEGMFPSYNAVFPYERPEDKRVIWIHAAGKVIRNDLGKATFMYGVYQDITEQKESELALAKAKQIAESSNKAKSEFLANMSHEIRTPMNAIIGFTELLDEQIKQPRLKSFVKTIQSASNNLLVIINDILDLSKIEAGKLTIEKKPCNPHELFTEISNIFIITLREKNIDLILDIGDKIPQSLQLDKTRLRQVLLNIIGNAVKFTDHGYIRVTANTDNENSVHSKLDLLISVEDTGIGISKNQQQKVFQDFEQSGGQDITKFGGTGLGLSISSRLVEMMGGEITLDSELGRGSIFTVKLNQVDVASLAVTPKKEIKPDTQEIIFDYAKILIVDDIKDNRDLLVENLSATSLQIALACNGQEAVDLVKQQDFDLVLMDLRMPVMDGYQAAEIIKTLSQVPVVALTASVMTDEFERIKSTNFDGYLRKPVLKAKLFEEMSHYLSHNLISVTNNENSTALNEAELQWVPQVLVQLKELEVQSIAISKNNNIAEIKGFSTALNLLSKQYPITILEDYAKQLTEQLDCFDISGLTVSLKNFQQLITTLEDEDN